MWSFWGTTQPKIIKEGQNENGSARGRGALRVIAELMYWSRIVDTDGK